MRPHGLTIAGMHAVSTDARQTGRSSAPPRPGCRERRAAGRGRSLHRPKRRPSALERGATPGVHARAAHDQGRVGLGLVTLLISSSCASPDTSASTSPSGLHSAAATPPLIAPTCPRMCGHVAELARWEHDRWEHASASPSGHHSAAATPPLIAPTCPTCGTSCDTDAELARWEHDDGIHPSSLTALSHGLPCTRSSLATGRCRRAGCAQQVIARGEAARAAAPARPPRPSAPPPARRRRR